MDDVTFAQILGSAAGALLLTAVLLVWRSSLRAAVRLLAVQGAALALLVVVIGIHEREPALLAVAALVLALKAVALPAVLARRVDDQVAGRPGLDRDTPRIDPTTGLVAVSLLVTLAYLVSRPLLALGAGPAARAIPVGIALVLIGFLLLVTRRRALSHLIAFLVLDNGIAAVAFLTAGGVPLVVELGASLDVLLVVLILQVLSGRIQVAGAGRDLDDLTELHD
jgi:hydrogenase-4 component E